MEAFFLVLFIAGMLLLTWRVYRSEKGADRKGLGALAYRETARAESADAPGDRRRA